MKNILSTTKDEIQCVKMQTFFCTGNPQIEKEQLFWYLFLLLKCCIQRN